MSDDSIFWLMITGLITVALVTIICMGMEHEHIEVMKRLELAPRCEIK